MSTLKSINVIHPSGSTNNLVNDSAGNVTVGNNLTTNGALVDNIGNVRNVPMNFQATGYTITATDAGKVVSVTGNVTVANVLTAGQTVTIYNNSAANISILQGSGLVMTLVGTSTTGTRTLAKYGLATVVCTGTGFAVITGGGLT